MADASLDEIESALLAALRTMHAAPPTDDAPFRLVDRWAGQVSHERGVDEGTVGRAPALLLGHESSEPTIVAATTDHEEHVVERHLFRVYVVIEDMRGDTKALKGSTHRPGILRAAHLVKLALTGLRIPNLYDGGTVELVGHRPWFRDGAHHVDVVWFAAHAGLPESLPDTPGAPLDLRGELVPPEVDTDGATVVVSPFALD